MTNTPFSPDERLFAGDDSLPGHQEMPAAADVTTLGKVATGIVEPGEAAQAETQSDMNTRIREEVIGGPDAPVPDAVFSFSGGITYDKAHNRHRTLAYSDLSEHGLVTGSRSRVIATAYIAKAVPGIPIVTNSFNRFDPDEPTMASVIAGELTKPVRGVDPSRIVREEKSFSTVTQLIEMINLTNEHNWQRVAVVGNWWHFPRMTRMYENIDTIVRYEDPAQQEAFTKAVAEFRERGVEVRFIPCENILRTADSKYGAYLDAAEATEPFQKTLAAEERGVADLEAGKYRVVLKPEKPREK